MKKEINIVWLKRDLRLQDHEPLFLAEKSGLPYIIIYIWLQKILHQFMKKKGLIVGFQMTHKDF